MSDFAIVTPSYNQAKFLRQTVESVLSQKNVSVEYWVIDGNSDDGSQKTLQSYGKKLHWVSEKDRGQTDAINKGVKKFRSGKASFFAYINSDDYYLPRTLEKVQETFEKYPEADWVVGDAVIVNEKNQEIQKSIRWYKKLFRNFYLPWFLFLLNPFPQPAVFLRWKVVQNVGEFNTDLRYVMDYEYWLKVQKKYGPPFFMSEPLAVFRIHGESKGGSQFHKQFAEQYQVVQSFTTNFFYLLLHRFHNFLTTAIYSLIK